MNQSMVEQLVNTKILDLRQDLEGLYIKDHVKLLEDVDRKFNDTIG